METLLINIKNKENKDFLITILKHFDFITKIDDINKERSNVSNSFEPNDYYGCLSNLNLDIENELKKMREEWTRDI